MLFNLFKILFYRKTHFCKTHFCKTHFCKTHFCKTHFCKTHFLRGDNYQNQEALRILISKVFS
ncbi:hypothetical protein D2C73_07120 [Helicobacter pylori]|nr:hypothetical protein D2C73_07120 [Helicobacter pylori]